MKQKILLMIFLWMPIASCGNDLDLFRLFYASFNPKLKANLQALSPQEQNEQSQFFSAGGPNGDQVLNAWYPAPYQGEGNAQNQNGVWLSQIHDPLSQLHRSECFWLSSDDASRLSWEVVLAGNMEDVNLDQVGACNSSHPVTREPLRYDGNRYVLPLHQIEYGNVVLETCTFGAVKNDSKNPCGGLDQACIRIASPCAGRHHPFFPFCEAHCEHKPVGDTTYQQKIVYEDPDEGIFETFHSRTISPHAKVISGLRALARPMIFNPIRSRTSEPDPMGNYHFFWRWPENIAQGHWPENFSPKLSIMKIKFFVEENGQRRYLEEVLAPSSIYVGNRECPTLLESPGEFNMDACRWMATPAYFHDNLVNRLEWNVDFRIAASRGNQPPVPTTTTIFIEFFIRENEPSMQQAGLMLDPQAKDLGDVLLGMRPSCFDCFTLTNIGIYDLLVERLEFQDPDHPLFFGSVNGGSRLPFVLKAGEFVGIDVGVDFTGQARQTGSTEPLFMAAQQTNHEEIPFALALEESNVFKQDEHPYKYQSQEEAWFSEAVLPGPKQAILVVTAKSGPQVFRVQAPVHARAVEADMDLLPATLSFVNPSRLRRGALVSSVGAADLHLDSMRIVGPDANLFRIYQVDGSNSCTPRAGASHCLAPGDSLVVYMEYQPCGVGSHEAGLEVTPHAGSTEIVKLYGFTPQGSRFKSCAAAPTKTQGNPASGKRRRATFYQF